MQTKKQSFKEALINVAIGYLISLVSLFLIFPILGIESSPGKNLLITAYFTVISVLRSYFIRRHYNNKKQPINPKKIYALEVCPLCEIHYLDENGECETCVTGLNRVKY